MQTVTRREYTFSTSNPSMRRSHYCQSGSLEEAQKHISYEKKKNHRFYSNIEDICWNFLEHDLKVTNKTEASGTVGESLRQAQNRQVGANYQISNEREKNASIFTFYDLTAAFVLNIVFGLVPLGKKVSKDPGIDIIEKGFSHNWFQVCSLSVFLLTFSFS